MRDILGKKKVGFNIPLHFIERIFVKNRFKIIQNSYNSTCCQATYPYPQFFKVKRGIFTCMVIFLVLK